MPIKKRIVLARKNSAKASLSKNFSSKTTSTSNDFFGIKTYLEKQGEKIRSNKRKQFAFFVLGFLVVYLVLTTVVSLAGDAWVKQTTAQIVQGLLGIEGIQTNSIGFVPCDESNWIGNTTQGECYSFFVADTQQPECAIGTPCPTVGKTIIISWLCTGVLEIIILIGAIIASFGVSWKKKAIGIVAAVILGIIFNLLRVVVTINLILSQNVQTVELAHDLLFRVILFIYIVAVYVAWFYFANNQKNPS